MQNLRDLLIPPELGSVIMDSFSQRETARLAASFGIVYPGVRIETLDHFQLAHDLAEDAFNDPPIMEGLAKALDERYADDLAEFRSMDASRIKSILEDIPKIAEGNGIGCVIWALARDGRQEVAAFLPAFFLSLEGHLRKQDRKIKKVGNLMEHLASGRLNQDETRRVKNILGGLSGENEELKKRTEKLEGKAREVSNRNETLKENLAAKEREQNTLKAELAHWKKDAASKSLLLEELRQKIQPPPRSEIESLRRHAHDLEREGRKKDHDLKELRENLEEKRKALEAVERGRYELDAAVKRLSEEKEDLEKRLAGILERNKIPSEASAAAPSRPAAPLRERGRRLGVFMDTQYLWRAAKQLQRKIDFHKLLETAVLGRHLVKAIAYAVEIPGKDQKVFFGMLERLGFQVRSRSLPSAPGGVGRVNWSVGIVLDAVTFMDTKALDVIHIIGGDAEWTDFLRFTKIKNVRAEFSAFPFNAPPEIAQCADEFVPLGEEILVERPIENKL